MIEKDDNLVSSVIEKYVDWGDSKEFIKDKIDKSDMICIAEYDNNIIGFSLAKNISNGEDLVVAFFATRVSTDFRRHGFAKSLISKVIANFIVKNKILNPLNWLKPVYIVTATASPLVYEQLIKRMNNKKVSHNDNEVKIACAFAKEFSDNNSFFDAQKFIIKGGFLKSTECYQSEKEVPWVNDEVINSLFKNELQVATGNGAGKVIVSRIL